jgi:hypothetical protein
VSYHLWQGWSESERERERDITSVQSGLVRECLCYRLTTAVCQHRGPILTALRLIGGVLALLVWGQTRQDSPYHIKVYLTNSLHPFKTRVTWDVRCSFAYCVYVFGCSFAGVARQASQGLYYPMASKQYASRHRLSFILAPLLKIYVLT